MIIFLQLLLTINIALQHEVPDRISRMLDAETQERRQLFGSSVQQWFEDTADDITDVWDDSVGHLEDFGNQLSGDALAVWNDMSEGAQEAWVAAENIAEEGADALKNIPVDDLVEFVEDVWDSFASCGSVGKCLKDFEIDGCMPGDNRCVITYGKECLRMSETIGVTGEVSISKSYEHEMKQYGGVIESEAGVKMYGAASATFNAGSFVELHLDSNPKVAVTIEAPSIDVTAEVGIEFSGSVNHHSIEKRIPLSRPKILFKRAFMAGPIPVYIEVEAQPVAMLTAEGRVDASGVVSYKFDDSFGFNDDIRIEVGLENFQTAHNLNSLSINLPEFSKDGFTSTLELDSEITIGVKVGVEIAVQLYNAVEFNLVPLVGASITANSQMSAQANFNGASVSGDGTVTFCLEGEFDSYFDYAVPSKGRREMESINILDSIETTCDQVSDEILGENCAINQLLTDVLNVCGVATDILGELGFPETINMPSLKAIDIPSFTTPDLCFDVSFGTSQSLSWQQASTQGSRSSPICPSGYEAVSVNLDGKGKLWAHPHPDSSRTIQDCANICNWRNGCTGFEYAEGPRSHGGCGTYTGGTSNYRQDENRLALESNWRSCMKVNSNPILQEGDVCYRLVKEQSMCQKKWQNTGGCNGNCDSLSKCAVHVNWGTPGFLVDRGNYNGLFCAQCESTTQIAGGNGNYDLYEYVDCPNN